MAIMSAFQADDTGSSPVTHFFVTNHHLGDFLFSLTLPIGSTQSNDII
jgi:hypothetical protein